MPGETEEQRYERKFLASHLSLAGAMLRIKLNSSASPEVSQERKINNITWIHRVLEITSTT